ncbi:hypothetical protein C8T65DRAFT_738590 [Cerioporus squamosus]|nr:hypothetical protein C8T65DRAFT_738590 [Cerioporus squamosus]
MGLVNGMLATDPDKRVTIPEIDLLNTSEARPRIVLCVVNVTEHGAAMPGIVRARAGTVTAPGSAATSVSTRAFSRCVWILPCIYIMFFNFDDFAEPFIPASTQSQGRARNLVRGLKCRTGSKLADPRKAVKAAQDIIAAAQGLYPQGEETTSPNTKAVWNIHAVLSSETVATSAAHTPQSTLSPPSPVSTFVSAPRCPNRLDPLQPWDKLPLWTLVHIRAAEDSSFPDVAPTPAPF